MQYQVVSTLTTLLIVLAGTPAAADLGERGCTGYSIPINVDIKINITSDEPIECIWDWTHAAAYAVSFDAPFDPNFGATCQCTEIGVDADAGLGYSAAGTTACRYESAGTGAYGSALSQVFCSSTLVSVDLKTTGIIQSFAPGCFSCPTPSLSIGGGAAGADLLLRSDGTFSVSVIDISSWPNLSIERSVIATIVCVDESPVAFFADTSINEVSSISTMSSQSVPHGVRSIQPVSVRIADAQDDITGDGRFNQLDVDFLAAIIGTPQATHPAYAKFDFVNDGSTSSDDGIQQAEIDLLQCFIEAGLSSGIVGDANRNGALDCNDIDMVYEQFNNIDGMNNLIVEVFPDSDYIAQLDADLDGDNDADDYIVIAERLIVIEPANFYFDTNLNFFDHSAYLALFNAGDPRADIYPAGNPDGLFNFFDLSQFSFYYSNPQCP